MTDSTPTTAAFDTYACQVCGCHHHTTERHGMDLIDTVYDDEDYADAYRFTD